MAKRKTTRKPTVEETQEMPVTIETVAVQPDHEVCRLINDDTGEVREMVVRAGYAPAPMPFGFRLAKADEVSDQ